MKKRLISLLLLCCMLLTLLPATVLAEGETSEPQKRENITYTQTYTYHCGVEGHADVVIKDKQMQFDSWYNNYYQKSITLYSSGDTNCLGASWCPECAKDGVVEPEQKVVSILLDGNEDACHRPLRAVVIPAREHQLQNIWRDGDKLTPVLTTDQSIYVMEEHPVRAATCTEVGYSEAWYECHYCHKLFSDAGGEREITADELRRAYTIPKAHAYDEDGKCRNCEATATARIGNKYYDRVIEALDALKAGDDLTILADYTDSFDISVSCKVTIAQGVAVGDISCQGASTIHITNNGTANEISLENNSDLIVYIENNGRIAMAAANGGSSDQPGELGKRLRLQNGTGTYAYIRATYASMAVLADGCYYFVPQADGSYTWLQTAKNNNYIDHNVIVSSAPFITSITAKANDAALTGADSFTTDPGKNVTLTAEATASATAAVKTTKPDAVAYSWYYQGEEAKTPLSETKTLTLENIPQGIHDLVLKATDEHGFVVRHSVRIAATSGKAVSIAPADVTIKTKIYDGTTDVPEGMGVLFQNEQGQTVRLQPEHYTILDAHYNAATVPLAESITAKVQLTEAGKALYKLTTDTVTASAGIEKKTLLYAVYYSNNLERSQLYGKKIHDCVQAYQYTVDENGHASYHDWLNGNATPTLLPPENATVTYYRADASRSPVRADPALDQIITEETYFNEAKLNDHITGGYEGVASKGYYYIYAYIGETENYAGTWSEPGMTSSKWPLTSELARHKTAASKHCYCVNSSISGSHVHETLTYDSEWTGDVNILEKQDTAYVVPNYTESTVSSVYLDIRGGKTLYVCLHCKTLSTAECLSKHICVETGGHLILSDCTGNGAVRGTTLAADGGCLLVSGTVDLYSGKLTGGNAQSGGAVVVEKGGVLNIYGGEITGNFARENGGAIYVKDGGTVNIYGGKLSGNYAYGSGGAIYIAAGGTVNLCGGEISGNHAAVSGGGIYVEDGGTLNVSGSPVVKENSVSDSANNLYLPSGKTIAVSSMTDGAYICITTQNRANPIVFTNACDTDYSAYFFADQAGLRAYYTDAKTLELRTPSTLDGNTLTVWTGTRPAGTLAVAAEYDASGRLLCVQSKTLTGSETSCTFTVKNSGASVKCFLLDSQHRPLGALLAQS